MANTNCLAGIKCPKCGNEDLFLISATCWATVTDDGVESTEDLEWDGESQCLCKQCRFTDGMHAFEEVNHEPKA
jgi:hypothetical protein